MLVTGFLGAGKTTFVNSLLRSRGSQRVAVFVNEFGDVDVDGEVLRGLGGVDRNKVLSLKDGCMCCGGKDDFETVLREEFHDAKKDLDYLIIETSGVSDPRPVLASLETIPNVYVDRVVCVVDATTLSNVAFGGCDGAQPQIACADVLVLSKVDLLENTSQELQAEKSLLAQHRLASRSLGCAATKPTVVRSSSGDVDLNTLRSLPSKDVCSSKRRRIVKTNAAASHTHDSLAKVSVVTPYEFDRKRFQAWAAALPKGLVRGKGLIH